MAAARGRRKRVGLIVTDRCRMTDRGHLLRSRTMRIGVFTDVHANLNAARAVVRSLGELGVDLIVHTGDSVSIGPEPAETLDYLLERDIILIRGNHEVSLRDRLHENPPDWMHPDEIEHERWASDQIRGDHRAAIDRMPELVRYRSGTRSVVLQHAGFDREGNFLSSSEEYEQWRRISSESDDAPDLIAFGHDHRLHDELAGGTRFVSPGAAGCTKQDLTPYGVIDLEPGGVRYERHEIRYDRAATIRRFHERLVPGRASVLRIFFGVE